MRRFSLIRRFLSTVRLLIAAIAAVSILALSSPVARPAGIGEKAGTAALIDGDGKEVAIANYGDRAATAFIFLSARSEAAAQTIADINQFYRKHRRLGVLYVGVCSGLAESPGELRDFAQKHGMIFTIYRDPRAELAARWNVKTVPAAVLVDSAGAIAHVGGLESEELQIALDAAIAIKIKPHPEEEPAVAASPIGAPGPKRNDPDRLGAPAFASELVFERIPGAPAHHCSTIAESPRGDLLCLWYGGSYESADDQVLFLARRPKGSRTWNAPQVLMQNAEHPPGNGVIFADGQKRVWIIWCRMESPRPRQRGGGWDNCRLMFRTSTDDGRTWSQDGKLLGDDLRAVPRNPPLRMASGELILAVEAHRRDRSGSVFLIAPPATDGWRLGGFVSGGSQPAVVQRKDGSLFALLRQAPHLTQTTSRDGGRSWSLAVASAVRNPNSGITMTRLANGHLVLVYNDSDSARTPLSVSRSLDEGVTWEPPMHLETNPGEYSYPCTIQSADGRIHVSHTFRRYSIKHVEFNEDWLVHTERPN